MSTLRWCIILGVLLPITMAEVSFSQARDLMMLKRAERGRVAANPEEVVSFTQDFNYDQALELINEMAMKFRNKVVVDLLPKDSLRRIGIEIRGLTWLEALELIARQYGGVVVEESNHFQVITPADLERKNRQAELESQIKDLQARLRKADTSAVITQPLLTGKPEEIAELKVDSAEIYAHSREVRISAVFFTLDRNRLKESGLSFSFFRGRDLNLQVSFSGASNVSTSIFSAQANPTPGVLTVDVSTALNIFENENIGEVISRPEVTVRSGLVGFMQVGTDFSIKERTISGDVVDKFFQSGILLTVRPTVFRYQEFDIISLNLDTERSDVTPDPISTRVNKTKNSTTLTLVNGEQMYVGGLFINEDKSVRQGIPVLKDLPWWVFGLRYLFGYNRVESIKKDLFILIRAELVPTPIERAREKLKDLNVEGLIKRGEQDRKETSILNKLPQ